MNNTLPTPEGKIFTGYEVFIIAILSILQFTIILDFMVLSPLGEQLMDELNITPAQFSHVVSAYAISAGISGLLAAGFADKFDRKKILLFFYAGFVLGTLFCGIAPDYNFLLVARIITGIFGGVIGSVSYAIISDLFKLAVRGRVMGFVQMAFATSQVLGIPVGLYLANHFGWHSPFLMIVGVSLIVGLVVIIYMKPINAHLKIQSDTTALRHFGNVISQSRYLKAFVATTLLATGGFMLMPFASAFSVHNLGISRSDLPMLYMITGIFSMAAGPIIGKFSDKFGKYTMFIIGSMISTITVLIYCSLGITPLWIVIAINTVMFFGIMGRIISSSALMTAVPDMKDRGAFMGINSSFQQISGGIASLAAGLIVIRQSDTSPVENYNILSYVVTGTMIITVFFMYFINQYVLKNQAAANKPIA